MRTDGLMIAAALALAAGACNSETGNNLSTDTNLAEDSAVNDVLGADQPLNDATALPTDAAGFTKAVAASDLYEIESARLASTKAQSAEVKEFAQHVLTDHQKSTADLKTAAGRVEPAIPVTPALDAEKQSMLDQLKVANGADFDRTFIDQQTNAHQEALQLLRNYVGGGDSQPLKDFAGQATTMVEGHLEHLNSIRQ